MAEDTEQLRAEIDQQRAAISEHRRPDREPGEPEPDRRPPPGPRPPHADGWKDTVLGNDEPDYPGHRSSSEALGYESAAATTARRRRRRLEAARDRASSAMETVSGVPETARRQTQGNPVVAGAVALGVGWLIGSLMPQSEKERELARKVEPQLAEVASTVKAEGQQMASDLQEPAQDAVEQIKEAGREATTEVKDSGAAAAQSVKEHASGS